MGGPDFALGRVGAVRWRGRAGPVRRAPERGLPRRALLTTVVIDGTAAGHAVLTVRTSRGDFILDTRTDAIRPWKKTGYGFLDRAGQDGAQVADAEP